MVSGPPGSGKSTLAGPLADQLQLPLVAKDVIKDALMRVLPPPDVEASRQLGRAAVAAMFAIAEHLPDGGVLESNLYRSAASPWLGGLPGTVVQVFCRCPRSEMERRYRLRTGTRHAGHFDAIRRPEELWDDDVGEPVAGPWPLIEVDTSRPVDVLALAAALRELGAGAPG